MTLSRIDKRNIERFRDLSPSHRRVFRHRLRCKCKKTLSDLQLLLVVCAELNLVPDDIVDIEEVGELLSLLEQVVTKSVNISEATDDEEARYPA